MIDIRSEKVVPIADVLELLPQIRGRTLHLSTVYRWISPGLRGVRLETAKVGGQTFTSMEALQRFSDALTATKEKTRGRREFAGKRGKARRPREASNAN